MKKIFVIEEESIYIVSDKDFDAIKNLYDNTFYDFENNFEKYLKKSKIKYKKEKIDLIGCFY